MQTVQGFVKREILISSWMRVRIFAFILTDLLQTEFQKAMLNRSNQNLDTGFVIQCIFLSLKEVEVLKPLELI